jgi:hypothetical protein
MVLTTLSQRWNTLLLLAVVLAVEVTNRLAVVAVVDF